MQKPQDFEESGLSRDTDRVMFEPLSTTIGLWLLSGCARPGSAISPEASDLAKAASAIIAASERSEALFGQKATLLSALMLMADECAESDWNGEGAQAIEPAVVRRASEFIRALPEGVSLPELSPAPDGLIILDWALSKRRVFSLSVGETDRLAYAWLDGTDKGHGVARFDGIRMPSRVLDGVQAVTNHGNAPLRAA